MTNRTDFAEKIRLLRDWGQAGKYNHVMQGFNYRMDALQAAILRIKLRHLPRWTELRRNAAARYEALLKPLGITPPGTGEWRSRLSRVRHIGSGARYRSAQGWLTPVSRLAYTIRSQFICSKRTPTGVLRMVPCRSLSALLRALCPCRFFQRLVTTRSRRS